MIRFLRYLALGLLALILLVTLFFGRADIPLEELRERYAPPPSAFMDVMGMPVHYRAEGPATDTLPLVLFHGTGASLHAWDGWVAALSDEHRIIRCDLPAFGLTGPFPDRDYHMDHFVKFALAFLDSLGIDRCILGGNSLGGQVAWRTAAARPERVERLILVDAAGYPYVSESKPLAFRLAQIPVLKHALTYITPRSILVRSVRNVYGNPDLVTDALIDRYYELSLRAGNRRAFVDRMNTDYDYRQSSALLQQLPQPTLILWGGQDRLIPPAVAEQFAADLARDTLVIFPSLGHVPMEEDAPGTAAVVRAWLLSSR
jgi:pimeloyl-ACP methyl ester carboxylesterase